jgi:hypothetical protein
MANGQRSGAHGSTRRATLPRVGSIEGVKARVALRIKHKAVLTGKFANGTKTPGSRNPRKVGRG